MRDDLDLAVFLHFPKVSREMSSLQGMLLGSSGEDALGMGCSGGTSGLWEQSVGSWNPVPPSHLHVCMVLVWQLDAGLPPSLWNGNVGRYREEGRDAFKVCGPCWTLWGHGCLNGNGSPEVMPAPSPLVQVWVASRGRGGWAEQARSKVDFPSVHD